MSKVLLPAIIWNPRHLTSDKKRKKNFYWDRYSKIKRIKQNNKRKIKKKIRSKGKQIPGILHTRNLGILLSLFYSPVYWCLLLFAKVQWTLRLKSNFFISLFPQKGQYLTSDWNKLINKFFISHLKSVLSILISISKILKRILDHFI